MLGTRLPRLAMSLCLAAAMLCGCGRLAADSPTRVRIDGGGLAGVAGGDVVAFKGIPFAAPPVGERRWRPPSPSPTWQGWRPAEQFGADCMQEPFPGDAAPLGVTPAEDCLYLNVWKPAHARAGEALPVMVWIYGGGFVNGGASPAVYDGSEFARRGVVLVSFNYRLAHFGFFAHPALSAEQGQPLVNYALMDQVAALQWVKRNIRAFGGDPANVTIFGESAGGMSVHALLTALPARGLFHKAIIQSGGGRGGLRERPLSGGSESAEGRGLAFGARYGIPGSDAAALARLRAIPAADIARGLHMMTMGRDATYVGGPVQDGLLVRGVPLKLYEQGEAAKVPVMVGATSADIGGDRGMIEPARAVARALAARGQPVYQFRFSYVAESMRAQWPGAPHATEIPFVFNTVAARYGAALTPADASIARLAVDYWTSFARTGIPVAAGGPDWPRYEAAGDQILDFTPAGAVAGADPWKARLDLAELQQRAAP